MNYRATGNNVSPSLNISYISYKLHVLSVYYVFFARVLVCFFVWLTRSV